ncbi:MAG: NAD(+)/NADH kinase [Desulforegulaceae bacterium]|nr:NAD(+)/NADH kinase [Desulforegulaceae bacterium]
MRAGIVVKESDLKVKKTSKDFGAWLETKGVEVIFREKKDHLSPPNPFTAPKNLDIIFVLGGDGTFLSAARWVGKSEIPLMGIKFGEVGFLAETEGSMLYEAVEKVINKNFSVEKRMRFQVELIRENQVVFSQLALNEAVIGKSGPAGLSRIDIEIDSHHVTRYSGDGLIISTPTGSTAYSLASGGPVVHPVIEAMLLVPICPFTLTNRPLIISDKSTICARLSPKSASPLKLSVDGQKEAELFHGDWVIIKKSSPVHLVTLPDQSYFDILKTRLKWSGERI